MAFANDLNILDESRLRLGGLGVVSLLEGLLAAAAAVALGFVLDFPKKSFAVDDISFLGGGSGLDSAGFGFAGWAFAGAGAEGAGAGCGLRASRRLTFLLMIVPYVAATSSGSSFAHSSCTCRVMSDRTWRSWDHIS